MEKKQSRFTLNAKHSKELHYNRFRSFIIERIQSCEESDEIAIQRGFQVCKGTWTECGYVQCNLGLVKQGFADTQQVVVQALVPMINISLIVVEYLKVC